MINQKTPRIRERFRKAALTSGSDDPLPGRRSLVDVGVFHPNGSFGLSCQRHIVTLSECPTENFGRQAILSHTWGT